MAAHEPTADEAPTANEKAERTNADDAEAAARGTEDAPSRADDGAAGETETETDALREPEGEEDAPAEPSRVDRLAPLVAGLLLAAPTLLARYPPMSDLPLHEGAVGVLRHFGDPAYFPEGLYKLNIGHPNQMFHLAAWLLSYVVSTDWAVKIVIALSQILIFHAGAKLSDHLGRARWGAVLLAPLALGFTYYWGLVANLIGYAVFLYALPLFDRFALAPTPRGLAKACGMFVLLYFAHESMFGVGAAVVGLFAILQPLDPKKTALRLAPVLFAVGGGYLHLVIQAKLYPSGAVVAPATFFSFGQKLYFLPNVLFGSHEMEALLMLLGLCAVSALGLVHARAAHDPAPEAVEGTGLAALRAKLFRFRFEALAAFFLFAYFALPFNWNGATLLHERCLGPAWAIFVLCAAPRALPGRVARIAAAVVPVAILFVSWPQFYDASTTYTDLDAILAKVPQGRAVTLCAVDRTIYHTRVYSAAVGAGRVLAVKGGRSGMSLTISPISPVLLDPKYRWDGFDRRIVLKGSRSLKPPYDLQRFDWVIAQSRDPGTRRYLETAFKPEAKLVAEQGEWLLFQSTFAPAPLLSPELVPPPGEPTILDRIQYLTRHDKPEEKKSFEDEP